MKQSYLSIVHELALETKARREFGLRETEDV